MVKLIKYNYLCSPFGAQVAELVDALVSNTNGVTPVPVRSRPWVQKRKLSNEGFSFFVYQLPCRRLCFPKVEAKCLRYYELLRLGTLLAAPMAPLGQTRRHR